MIYYVGKGVMIHMISDNNTAFGYVRVSDVLQCEDRQVAKMKELGVSRIIVEKASGKDFNRPKYQQLKETLAKGDVLFVDALDRLGRTYDGIKQEWYQITKVIGADIICLDNPELFNSKKYRDMGDIGKVMEDTILAMLSYVAEQERKKIKIRQSEGIAQAKLKGKHLGRFKIIDNNDEKFQKVYTAWKSDEITAVEACNTLGISRPTFYRRVKELQQLIETEKVPSR